MDGMEITVQHVNIYQDVNMEGVLINPILVTVKLNGKAYFVMSPFASKLLFIKTMKTKFQIRGNRVSTVCPRYYLY